MTGGDAHCIMMEGDCCYIEISFFFVGKRSDLRACDSVECG